MEFNKMLEIIKKSLITVKNNPILPLALVLYLIIFATFAQSVSFQNSVFVIVFFIALFVLNAGFFSGWFGMIKKANENADKEYKTEDEKLQDILDLRKEFFASVASYILPVFSIFILHYFAFLFWMYLNIKLANRFLGSINFLLNAPMDWGKSINSAVEFLSSLPPGKLEIIRNWQTLFICAIFLFIVFTIFVLPALYYAKDNYKNPFLAFFRAFTAVFKRPLGVLGLNLFIIVSLVCVQILGYTFSAHKILSFIYLVLLIYVFVFLVVLIFKYYGDKIADNSDNGPDSSGENKDCDKGSEGN
jgi:hypothetical protein